MPSLVDVSTTSRILVLANLGFTVFIAIDRRHPVGSSWAASRRYRIGAYQRIKLAGYPRWFSARRSCLAGYLGTALALGGIGIMNLSRFAAPLGLLGSVTWSLRSPLLDHSPLG
jgi:hypothetical protein